MGLEEFNAAYEFYAVNNAGAPFDMEVLWNLPSTLALMGQEYFPEQVDQHRSVQGSFWGLVVVSSYLFALFGGMLTFYTVNGVWVFIYSFFWCHRGSDFFNEPTPSPRFCLENSVPRPYNPDPLSQVWVIKRGA